jgi:uncharacterized membrane-anchored protein YhcB (DUF1043 family)
MSAFGIGLLAFVLGAAVALVVRWGIGGPTVRERELEEELAREREKLATHHEAVEKHFEQTGQLFQDLSHQHALLYRHLSDGMRQLCGDRPNLLPPGAAPRALPEPEGELRSGDAASARLRDSEPRPESSP